MKANYVYSAIDTALAFATNWGRRDGALFYCWVPVALNSAVGIRAVAEEVRELNSYRSWSAYQLEGEITAKIEVPANQIKRVEWWDIASCRGNDPSDFEDNPNFQPPSPVLNVRELF
jgi:hypothetical protein